MMSGAGVHPAADATASSYVRLRRLQHVCTRLGLDALLFVAGARSFRMSARSERVQSTPPSAITHSRVP
jgi:hypothetical protein